MVDAGLRQMERLEFLTQEGVGRAGGMAARHWRDKRWSPKASGATTIALTINHPARRIA